MTFFLSRHLVASFFQDMSDLCIVMAAGRFASLHAVVIFRFCGTYVASLLPDMRDLCIVMTAGRFASLHAVVIFYS